MHDITGSMIVILFFFVPSALVLSLITFGLESVISHALERRSNYSTASFRTRFVIFWTLLVSIRVFCLWQINAPQEGAGQYLIGAVVTPEICIIDTPAALTAQLILRVGLAFFDSLAWAFLLAKARQHRSGITSTISLK